MTYPRIALVGHPLSGKDTVAGYLTAEHGYIHIATSDLLRFYIAEHELGEPTRERMHDVANVLRAEHGADYLVRLALRREEERLVISGLRTVAEAETARAEGALIVQVRASLKLRYKRALERRRVGEEAMTLEAFRAIEEKESENDNPEVQNVNAVIALASLTLENEGNLEHLHGQVEKMLETTN